MVSQEGKLLSRGTCKDCQNMPEGAEVNIGNWTCEVDRPMGNVCARCSSVVQAFVSPQIGALQLEMSLLHWSRTDAVQPCGLPQIAAMQLLMDRILSGAGQPGALSRSRVAQVHLPNPGL